MKKIKILLLGILLSGSMFQGCKKDEKNLQSNDTKTDKISTDKLIGFLAVRFNTIQDSILYNSKTEEFVIKNSLRKSLKVTLEQYKNANEYRINYEK